MLIIRTIAVDSCGRGSRDPYRGYNRDPKMGLLRSRYPIRFMNIMVLQSAARGIIYPMHCSLNFCFVMDPPL